MKDSSVRKEITVKFVGQKINRILLTETMLEMIQTQQPRNVH